MGIASRWDLAKLEARPPDEGLVPLDLSPNLDYLPLLSEEKVRKDNEMENYSYVVMHPN